MAKKYADIEADVPTCVDIASSLRLTHSLRASPASTRCGGILVHSQKGAKVVLHCRRAPHGLAKEAMCRENDSSETDRSLFE